MNVANVLLVVGAMTIVVGIFGNRFSQGLAAKRRWILIAGIAILALGFVLGNPELIRGAHDALHGG
jgi:hypothetical protein